MAGVLIFALVKKLRRWGIRLLVAIFVLIALGLIFISPICEWAIEKYSEEYIGRKVQMEDLGINLLMGTIRIEKLEIKEQKSDVNWLTCDEIKAGIHSGKLLSGSYVVPEVFVDGLQTTIIQKGDHFNFDDLLNLPAKYASQRSEPATPSEPTIWEIHNVTLQRTSLRYISPDYNIDYTASDIHVVSPLLAWDKADMHFDFGFAISTGGQFDGAYEINTADLNYNLHLITTALKLDAAKPYLDEFIALKTFAGQLGTDLYLHGNHLDPDNLTMRGKLDLKDLRCIDGYDAEIAAVDAFDIGIDSIAVASNYYDFGDISITGPRLKFEMFPDGDNWSRLMAPAEVSSAVPDSSSMYSNPFVLLANYIRTYVKDYVVSDYYADHITMRSGELIYNDGTLHEPFVCILDSMYLDIDRLNTDLDRLKMTFGTRINEAGNFRTNIAINPRDYQDMECNFDFRNLPATMFNPYMTYYVATPFTQGDISFDNETHIESGKLTAQNALFVEQPKTGAKVINETAMKLPVKLAVSLLKNVDGNIDLEIPVEGDLNDPEYKLRKAIWSIVKNLLLKAVQAPGNLLAKIGGDKEENLQEILITYGLNDFTPDQQEAIGKMAKPLLIKPELNILFTQCADHEEELDAILLLETRKQFAIEKGIIANNATISQEDFNRLIQISIQDSIFTSWLTEKTNTPGQILSIPEKCRKLIDIGSAEVLLRASHVEREKRLRQLFNQAGIPDERIQFNSTEVLQLSPGDIARFKYEIAVDEQRAD